MTGRFVDIMCFNNKLACFVLYVCLLFKVWNWWCSRGSCLTCSALNYYNTTI